jgi:RNA polymerase sigma-70 factor (ECF subfamily)
VKTKSVLPLSEYRKLSDEEVVHRYVHRHESQAMSALFERYAHLVLGVCFNTLKEPRKAAVAAQEIFTGMLEDLKRSEINDFRSWLIQYTFAYCGRQSGTAGKAGFDASEFPSINESAIPEREFLLLKLDSSLSLLPEQQVNCLTEFYLHRKTFRAICRQTGLSLIEVRKLIRSGRNRLISLLHLSNTTNTLPS